MRPIKRSVNISGHATSITLEQEFWSVLKDIAARRGLSVNALIADIDQNKNRDNLSSAIRIYILRDLLNRIASS
jgi:predicted DNA-binding ribbon-helix-helix protein